MNDCYFKISGIYLSNGVVYMKIQILIISIILLIANSIVPAELKFKLSGKDEYPFF